MVKEIKKAVYQYLSKKDIFNNTLSPRINMRYNKFANLSQKKSKLNGFEKENITKIEKIIDPIKLESILKRDIALKISSEITKIVSDNKKLRQEIDNPVFTGIKNPISSLGKELIQILKNPVLDNRIKSHFGSYYQVAWLDCYRTVPSTVRTQAWLWHSDNVPIRILKLQLLLSDADKDTGAISFISHNETLKMRKLGYFGDIVKERVKSLVEYAERFGMILKPTRYEAKAGDVLLFDNNNLHCAIPPTKKFRDAVTILLLPSSKPWDEVYKIKGKESVESSPGGYPLYPTNPE